MVPDIESAPLARSLLRSFTRAPDSTPLLGRGEFHQPLHLAEPWLRSSHRHYAYGEENDLVTDAPEYLALGATGPQRRKSYLHLFARQFLEPLLVRRPDLVEAPFVGEASWLTQRLVACGLSPPS
jgi:hypothetical protein